MHAALRSTKISAGVCDFLDQPTLARLAAHAARSRNARWMPYGKSTGFRNYMLLHPLSPEVAAKVEQFRSPNHWLRAIAVHSPPPFDPLPPLFPKLEAIKGTCPTPDDIALFNWSNGPSLRQLQIGP
ncbi:hypothetical protein OG21DRAFT_1519762 [Imleria badia]|nr:hypothetical protein OG21DRAFT_1519762 [Imleria badia]